MSVDDSWSLLFTAGGFEVRPEVDLLVRDLDLDPIDPLVNQKLINSSSDHHVIARVLFWASQMQLLFVLSGTLGFKLLVGGTKGHGDVTRKKMWWAFFTLLLIIFIAKDESCKWAKYRRTLPTVAALVWAKWDSAITQSTGKKTPSFWMSC